MGTNANCMFKVTGWNEEPYEEFEGGAKLTRAKVSQSYQGDISGEGSQSVQVLFDGSDESAILVEPSDETLDLADQLLE